MASIQARHERVCRLAPWSTFDRATEGCDCRAGATYYVVVRDGGKLHRDRVGKNRRDAQRALTKIQGREDDGAYIPQLNIPFRTWGERWLAGLELKPTTIHSYTGTIRVAADTFGTKPVRRITTEDVKQFSLRLREQGASDSTRARHLRGLAACLSSAIRHGYAARNPVREVPRAERPRPAKREAAYFTDDELAPLMAAVDEPLMQNLFLTALKTGARQGELLAAVWGDLNLTKSELTIRRSITGGHIGLPKSHERRTIDLTPDLVKLLGAWWGECGRPDDGALVFPGDTKTGYVNPQTILRRSLYPAMKTAGIDRAGPTGENRTFHSFRHTFARVALENGAALTWLSRHLGHSSTMITDTIYGHWGRAARKREVEKLVGAFAV